MDFETILVEKKDNVLVITLNRPDRLNAAPPRMFDEIREATADIEGARALIITSNGTAFCSGADLAGGELHKGDRGDAIYDALSDSFHPTLQALARLPIPIVTAVPGAAAGIGSSLALAADFCIASEEAYFVQSFTNIGLVPDGGASWLLPRLVGRARAMELLLLGDRVGAHQALEWGMIHKVVAADELEQAAMELAQRLSQRPTVAIGFARQCLAHSLDSSFPDALNREAEYQRMAIFTEDAAEGTKAFLEKRPPSFLGK